MLTSKQRSKLKSLAANLSPIGQVGKEGIGENMLASFSDCLEKRELIKINILENADGDPKELGRELAERLNAECVIVIGRKAVLYRPSNRKDIEHININA
jgi:RNA-binding protein